MIDWVNSAAGNPFSDVARTSFLLTVAALPSHFSNAQRTAITTQRQHFHDMYIQHYTQLCGVATQDIFDWYQVIAAARLSEGITDTTEKQLVIAYANGK